MHSRISNIRVRAITADIHDSHHSTRQSPQHTTSHCYSPQHTTSPALTTTYDTTLLLTTALNITYDTTATHHRSPHCYSTQHSPQHTTPPALTTTHDTATTTDTNAYDTLPDHTLSSPLRYDPPHTLLCQRSILNNKMSETLGLTAKCPFTLNAPGFLF